MGVESPVAGKAGAVRIQRLGGVALSAAEAHGKRLDVNGRGRAVGDAEAHSTTGLELNKLYEAHVMGAKVQKSATKALHMVLQFPKELVDGDRAEYMLEHARIFAFSVFGSSAVFADRVDRDEKSRHVVDLFLAPKYYKQTKRQTQRAISTSKHLKELAVARGRAPTLRGQGQALQDAWHEYMRDYMDLDVRRGEPKKRPGSDWQTPEALEADRVEKLATDFIDTMKAPTRLDLVRPDSWFADFQEEVRTNMQPLLEEASEAITERIRRMEAEKEAAKAKKAASEAENLAQIKFEERSRRFQQNAFERMSSLEAQIGTLRHDLTQESDARKVAEDRARHMESESKALRAEVGQLRSFLDSTRATLKRVLGDGFEALRQRINQDWAKHPENPERPEAPPPPSRSSGPSPG